MLYFLFSPSTFSLCSFLLTFFLYFSTSHFSTISKQSNDIKCISFLRIWRCGNESCIQNNNRAYLLYNIGYKVRWWNLFSYTLIFKCKPSFFVRFVWLLWIWVVEGKDEQLHFECLIFFLFFFFIDLLPFNCYSYSFICWYCFMVGQYFLFNLRCFFWNWKK